MLPPDSCDTKVCPFLTEKDIDDIAEKAAEKAIEKLTSHVYQEVGKSVVSKFVYIVGALTLGLYLWMKSKGWIA
jgi:hypothetical protein